MVSVLLSLFILSPPSVNKSTKESSVSTSALVGSSGSVVLLSAASSSSSRLLSREAIPRLEDIEVFGLWGRNHSGTAEKC